MGSKIKAFLWWGRISKNELGGREKKGKRGGELNDGGDEEGNRMEGKEEKGRKTLKFTRKKRRMVPGE